jgi:hypothetical protein
LFSAGEQLGHVDLIDHDREANQANPRPGAVAI